MSRSRTTNRANSVPDVELAKIALEHKLSVKRMVIDKVLLGLLVGLAGVAANLLIENFKARTTEAQFFLEQRHAAATNFRKTLSEIVRESLRQTEFPCTLDPSSRDIDRAPILKAVSIAVDQLDSSSLLFSRDYLERVDRVLNIFGGVAAKDVKITCNHRLFFLELADYATYLTRQEVSLDRPSRWNGFVPAIVSREELEHMGSIEYQELNFQKWMGRKVGATVSSRE